MDPAADYAVRMRTRKSPYCLGSEEWSSWSDPIGQWLCSLCPLIVSIKYYYCHTTALLCIVKMNQQGKMKTAFSSLCVCVCVLCVVLFVVFVCLALSAGSRFNLNVVLIGSILLGTPMIVLALLLLLRQHR